MSDQSALLAAIIANPDEDTPRLAYADWLDENSPDKLPSPSAGPSARAEYIRVQCRLAGLPFDEPDYPELLEREEDLADWLSAHTPGEEPDLPDDLVWYGQFNAIRPRSYVRGFPEQAEYDDYDDDPDQNIERILEALPEAFAKTTVRSLLLENAYGEEIVGLMKSPVMAGLRGLELIDIEDDNEADAIRAIATSPHLTGLRRLSLEFDIQEDDLRRLAKADHLGSLETLSLDGASSAGLKPLGNARWFRNLRSLDLWLDGRDALKIIAEWPEMPNLVSLTLRAPTATPAVRKFAASDSFPRLKELEFVNGGLTAEQVPLLARGSWPLRRLKIHDMPVRKAGAEAIANAPFAETLRVLELSECELTAGAAQALAAAPALAGLRHLDLDGNPLGPGGLAALARSAHLRGLRSLTLSNCNSTKAPLDTAALHNFLGALEMPELRHLKLDRLPVGVRGARALAASGSFANLTRLSLRSCGLRETGTRAIVESATLPDLTVLDVSDNAAGKGLSKLADPKVFPRLARANVTSNRIPKWTLSRLRKRPAVRT